MAKLETPVVPGNGLFVIKSNPDAFAPNTSAQAQEIPSILSSTAI